MDAAAKFAPLRVCEIAAELAMDIVREYESAVKFTEDLAIAKIDDQEEEIRSLRMLDHQREAMVRYAKEYRGVDSQACPFCDYHNGVAIKVCGFHETIDNLLAELGR